jgi:glycosyltransferase involved in cell wall biosynthesis
MGKQGWRFYRIYEKWIHRKADFNFFITEEDHSGANRQYSLDPLKSAVIPYGIENNKIIENAKKRLAESLGVSGSYLLYFNGTLDYAPNTEAVEKIINEINPRLLVRGIDFKIIISGKRLHASLQNKVGRISTICYLGFAQETALLYQGCTLFINPVTNDSGVKTKVVEALSQHCTVVSTRSGATGIPNHLSAGKLLVSENRDWDGFVENIINCLQMPPRETPPQFFKYFQWESVAGKAAQHINNVIRNARYNA